jgi:hypothetical protein
MQKRSQPLWLKACEHVCATIPQDWGEAAKTMSRLADIALSLIQREPAAVPAVSTTPAEPTFDADAGELAAVKLRNTLIGDVWLVADPEALAEHPDIIRAGLPVFFFDEVEMLRGKTPAELKAIGMVKAEFPTSRVLQ